MSMLCSTIACLGERTWEDEHETSSREIRYGTETLAFGVVGIDFSDNKICTGAMIHPNYIVTSAHCLVGKFPGRQGHFKATIWYFDPETGKRRITQDGSDEVLVGFYKETYNTDPDVYDVESDIGLIFRGGSGSTPTPKTWRDTSSEDYLRIDLGNCGQIKRNDFFGRGYEGFSEKGSDRLRTTPILIEDCRKHYFLHLAGAAQLCGGDSGGPHIVKSSGLRAIAGLHSDAEATKNSGPCTIGGGDQRAMRMNDDKVSWLESKMDRICHEEIHDDHRTTRCWGSRLARPN
jgi:hypothetical protein